MSEDATDPTGRADETAEGADVTAEGADETADGADETTGNEDATGDPAHVVTAFLRHRGEVLLLRRSDAVGTYRGEWGGVSGYAEGDPDAQVRREIAEETGLADAVDLVRAGATVRVADEEGEWVVHPYLFDCTDREVAVELSEEHVAAEWVPATEMHRMETVPSLWTAYERVAPSVRSVAADDEHGSAHLSVRALEVLRDRAGLLAAEGAAADEAREELGDLARRLLRARPSMAALKNRVHRVMATAADGDGVAADAADVDGPARAVERAAIEGVERALAADAEASLAAADLVADARVLTLSRSGTVRDALTEADPDRVFVAESRPAREGVGVAESLAGEANVTLHTDAAAAHVLSEEGVDRVLVGADTVLADGRVVNKTGTRAVALAAAHEGVDVYAVAASDKVSPATSVRLESGDRTAVYEGSAAVDVLNPTFDVTPADAVTGVVTERRVLDIDDVASVAVGHRERADWEADWA